MSLARLKEYLDSQNIKYVIISHSVAYTAQGIAALAHIPGKELAKTVIVKLDGTLAMAVLPASLQVDLSRLKAAADATDAALASEREFKDRFPDCETGAMPPFGNLYELPVFADQSLSPDKEIAFNAGSHRELVQMAWQDFDRLVKPRGLSLRQTELGPPQRSDSITSRRKMNQANRWVRSHGVRSLARSCRS